MISSIIILVENNRSNLCDHGSSCGRERGDE
jgi:hypothetical protein